MTGRSGEVADALERRKVKVYCVQETRWKGEGTRILRTKTGGKYKLCAPQTGRSQEEKDNFWEAVWKLIEGI